MDALLEHNGQSSTRNVGRPGWRTGDFSNATRDAGVPAAEAPGEGPLPARGGRIAELEQEVQELRNDLNDLRQRFEALESQLR